MRNRLPFVSLAALILLLVTGCSTMRQLTSAAFTDARLADLVRQGNAGQFVALDSPGAEGVPELSALNVGELGVLLPVTPVGTSRPLWIVCLGEMATTCRKIPLGARVRVTGAPVNGGAILPTRLTWED